MTNRLAGVIAALVVVVVVVAGVAVLASGAGPYAFRVGSRETSQASLDDELRAIGENARLRRLVDRAHQQNPQVPTLSESDGTLASARAAGWVTLSVQQQVAAQEVARRGLHVTAADRREGHSLAVQALGGNGVFSSMPAWFRDRVARRFVPIAVLERDLAANPAPSIIDAAKGQCASGRYVSHILVATREEALALKARLDAGADFAKVAKASSTDTASAAHGGELGCLTDGEYIEPFQTVAATQPIGVVSDPVQSQVGFSLILVTDRPPGSALDEATISEVLGHSRGKRVDVDPRYGCWDRKGGRVLPASARACSR